MKIRMKPASLPTHFAWLPRIVLLAAMLAAAMLLLQFYARLWLPLITLVVQQLLPEFLITHAQVMHTNAEWLIAFDLATRHSIAVAQGVIPPGTVINASTLAGHTLKAPLVLAAAIVLWPLPHWHLQLQRTGLSLSAIVVLTLLDIPFMIAGAVGTLFDAHNFLTVWMQWLDGGGRFALALVVAVLIRAISDSSFYLAIRGTKRPDRFM